MEQQKTPVSARSLFINIVTSGKQFDVSDGNQMIAAGRYALLNFFMLLAAVAVISFMRLDAQRGDASILPVMIAIFVIVVGIFILARTKVPIVFPAFLTTSIYLIFCVFMVYTGASGVSSALWSLVFPLLAIYLLDNVKGQVLSYILLVALLLLFHVPGLAKMVYPLDFTYRFDGVYIFLLIISIVVNRASEIRGKMVYKLADALKVERDEMLAMKDNIKTGVFVLNQNWVIQPYYSHALETILEHDNLAGMGFIDLLENSISKKDRETLADYFSMVSNKIHDQQMLEDINPLQEFSYVVSPTSKKTLCATFVPLERSDGKSYLLATIEDKTRESELEQQLSEEDSRLQEEMKSFFEVVHIDPNVLNDFIEETDREFVRINDILKNKSLDAHTIMLEMYQGVHSIKSNALILGLESFAVKLHKLEDTIRALRDSPEISFEDVLHTMIELDVLMKVNDGLHSIITKITDFSHGGQKMQTSQVLTQTLERILTRLCGELGKEMHLIVKHLDIDDLTGEQRHIIKEVLVQLARNAVFHGLETPPERTASGKKPCGTLTLSIVKNEPEGKLKVTLADDGCGIDFKAIGVKAHNKNLISDPEKLSDKKMLAKVLFMPGFSTVETANMHAGRGVGLSLVHDRVKSAGGTIQIQSEEKKGTAFVITMPLLNRTRKTG